MEGTRCASCRKDSSKVWEHGKCATSLVVLRLGGEVKGTHGLQLHTQAADLHFIIYFHKHEKKPEDIY